MPIKAEEAGENIVESDFKEYPKSLAQNDFWGQVKRTVHGQSVSEEQIGMIVAAISDTLQFSATDTLLDLGCGNGALSQRLFDRLQGFLGVDFSDYLISVAREHFESLPNFRFQNADVANYVDSEKQPEQFTKALCYGCFSYFDKPKSAHVLEALKSKFFNVSKIFIGNLPDKDRVGRFFRENPPDSSELENHDSKIGIWRTKEEFNHLARSTGWHCHFLEMPEAFYAAHYRYDVLLERMSE